MIEIPFADSTDALARVTAALDDARLVALDTEFVREKTYYPELCLVQIATEELIACIDCLAGCDVDALVAALMHPSRVWVLHSARQDLEVVWNLAGRLPPALIDTQIAGALLGMAPQTSLQKLLEETLGVTIEKDQTRAQWNRRPLPAAALAYALNDVRHLLDAWHVLETKLATAGRLGWLDEECRRLLAADPLPTSGAVLERTKGIGALPVDEQRAALALVEWRERRARDRNRPRRWILPDDALVALARARPATQAALAAVGGLPPKLADRHGAELVAAIAASGSLRLPPALVEADPVGRPDKAKLKALQAQVRARAEALGIAAELLATRRDLAAVAAGTPPAHLREGWRAGVLSDLL